MVCHYVIHALSFTCILSWTRNGGARRHHPQICACLFHAAKDLVSGWAGSAGIIALCLKTLYFHVGQGVLAYHICHHATLTATVTIIMLCDMSLNRNYVIIVSVVVTITVVVVADNVHQRSSPRGPQGGRRLVAHGKHTCIVANPTYELMKA